MSEVEKEAEEKRIFNLFCSSDFYKAKPPAPDFVNKSKTVGYELTGYHIDSHISHKGSKEKQDEQFIHEVICEALTQYTGQKVNVYAGSSTTNLRKKTPISKKIIAQKLAEFISLNNSVNDVYFKPKLPKELNIFDSIHIYPSSKEEWGLSKAGNSEPNIKAIQELINKKEPKIKNYRTIVKEVSLIIHASAVPLIGSTGRGRVSTFARVTDTLKKSKFTSTFDSVYFLSEADNETIKLNITN